MSTETHRRLANDIPPFGVEWKQQRYIEHVPLKESIQANFDREVKPHIPDAWIDHSKTKVGYEIPLHRHEPPRELSVIEAEIRLLGADIVRLLGEVRA